MKIEVSNGEIADKLSIIEIKLKYISNPEKVMHLQNEYEVLNSACSQIIDKSHTLYLQLYEINHALWEIEDKIRELERIKQFDTEFIETARSVYFTNDKRSDVKRQINELTNSQLFEEKSYEKY
jgi:chaperonin cofactor prefoldin